jgi:hypothetical protein
MAIDTLQTATDLEEKHDLPSSVSASLADGVAKLAVN